MTSSLPGARLRRIGRPRTNSDPGSPCIRRMRSATGAMPRRSWLGRAVAESGFGLVGGWLNTILRLSAQNDLGEEAIPRCGFEHRRQHVIMIPQQSVAGEAKHIRAAGRVPVCLLQFVAGERGGPGIGYAPAARVRPVGPVIVKLKENCPGGLGAVAKAVVKLYQRLDARRLAAIAPVLHFGKRIQLHGDGAEETIFLLGAGLRQGL